MGVLVKISRVKRFPKVVFGGHPSSELSILTFEFSESQIVARNELGHTLILEIPHFLGFKPVVELYEDGEKVIYEISLGKYSITLIFDFASYPNKVKVTIRGKAPKKAILKLPIKFSDPERAWLDATRRRFWIGNFIDKMLVSGIYIEFEEKFSFNVQTYSLDISVDGNFQIDPVVGTSTVLTATFAPFQRKCFYGYGRFWVFYSDGTNMVYSSSTDGSTWTTPTSVRDAGIGEVFSIYFDGTYVHYAYGGGEGGELIYRRGLPASDGTITWDSEVTVKSASSYTAYECPTVAVDSDGYPWIGYRYGAYDPLTKTWSYYAYVSKGDANDGTWGSTTDYNLSSSINGRVCIVPLTGGKMYAVYTLGGRTIRGKLWDGSAWSDEETVSSTAIEHSRYFSVVSEGDNVHVVFLADTTYDILYVKRTYGVGWSAETTIQSATTSTSAPVIALHEDSGDLYVFWAGSPTADHIYYKKYDASTGIWDASPTDWIDESAETLTDNDRLTCFFTDGNYIGLTYMTSTSSPFNVKFAFLTMIPPPVVVRRFIGDGLTCIIA